MTVMGFTSACTEVPEVLPSVKQRASWIPEQYCILVGVFVVHVLSGVINTSLIVSKYFYM